MKILDPDQLSGMKAVDLKSLAEQVAEDKSATYDEKSAALTAIGSALATRQQAIASAKAWSVPADDGRPPAGVGGPLSAPVPAAFLAAQGVEPSRPAIPSDVRAKGRMPAVAFDEQAMRAMFAAAESGQPINVKSIGYDAVHTKDFSGSGLSSSTTTTGSGIGGLLPPQLATGILEALHEERLANHLPVLAIGAPSYEYIRHTGTVGAPAITGEGATKPEVTLTMDHQVATVRKIACHSAASWETVSDYDRFVGYLQQELTRQVIDVETHQLLYGDGTGNNILGLSATPGILTHTVGSETAIDAVEQSISALRTGSALAVPDLFVTEPGTWSAIRRTKNTLGNYILGDPGSPGVNSLWGIRVIVSTAVTAGQGFLIDSNKFGVVLLREAVNIRQGTNADDFAKNLLRWTCEERLTLAVERPTAALKLANLPTTSQGS